MYDYMPTDTQFKNDLRIQRDELLELKELVPVSKEMEKFHEKIDKILKRIQEALED